MPAALPSYLLAGYGAINRRSTDLGIEVLAGLAAEPARPDVGAFYAQDQLLRRQLAAFE